MTARVGISGLGSIGQRHARVARGLGYELALFDPAGLPEVLLAELPSSTTCHSSFEDLLDSDLDALIVATPDEAHAPQAIAACQQGVPVLVEKPLAASAAQARRVEAAAAASQTPLVCGYVVRHSPVLQGVKEILSEGTLGEVASFHVELGAYDTLVAARNRFTAADRNRLFFDYSHEWDYLRWIFGRPLRCTASARTIDDLVHVQRPNVIDALLELDGAGGSVHLDYVRVPSCRVLEVVSSRGTCRADVLGATLRVTRGGSHETTSFDADRDHLLASQLVNLLEAAEGRADPIATAADGVAALEIAEAMIEAAEQGRWVSFGRDKDD